MEVRAANVVGHREAGTGRPDRVEPHQRMRIGPPFGALAIREAAASTTSEGPSGRRSRSANEVQHQRNHRRDQQQMYRE